MTATCLGVDLGTCSSSVGFHDGRNTGFVKDPAADLLTYSIPSSVLVRRDGSLAFGALAESEKAARPECYQSQFKRDLGSSTPYELGGQLISPDDLTARLLGHLVELSCQTVREPPSSVVITVPATYSGHRRAVIEQAAAAAGLSDVAIVPEPVAAVVAAVDRGEVPATGTILVYDLGGGTFDAALVTISGGRHEVLGARGLADFGGSDIDRLIERDLWRRASAELEPLLSGRDSDDPAVRRRAHRALIAAREVCRTVKHRLSSAEEAYGDIGLMISYELDRPRLEAMARPHLERTLATCRLLVAETGVAWTDITGVLLAGGPCRMPFVGRLVAAAFDRPVWPAADPELVVCAGAIVLATRAGTGVPVTSADLPAEPAPDRSQPAREPDAPSPSPSDSGTATTESQEGENGEHGEEATAAPGSATGGAGRAANARPQAGPAELIRTAHGGMVNGVAFSPSGNHVASASNDRTARIWDASTGEEQHQLQHKPGVFSDVRAVAFSPDGATLAIASSTLTRELVRLVDPATGQDRAELAKAGTARAVAFHPDGTLLATAGALKTAAVWHWATGTQRAALAHEKPVNAVAFDRSGHRLATAGEDRTVRVWYWSAVKELARFPHDKGVNAVAFSPDGTRLAAGGDDRRVRVWDLRSGGEVARFVHGKGVNAVAFSPDGTRLATASDDGSARVWDVRTGGELQRIQHQGWVRAVVFDPGGSRLATGGMDSAVHVWAVPI